MVDKKINGVDFSDSIILFEYFFSVIPPADTDSIATRNKIQKVNNDAGDIIIQQPLAVTTWGIGPPSQNLHVYIRP